MTTRAVAHVAEQHWEDKLRAANVLSPSVCSVDAQEELRLFLRWGHGLPSSSGSFVLFLQTAILILDFLKLPFHSGA